MIPQVPFYRTFSNMLKYHDDPIRLIEKTTEDYGLTYTFKMTGFGKYIMTSDPDFVEHVFVKNQKKYQKSEMQTELMGKYLGKGLLTSNGAYWLKQRRMIQPAFHKQKIKGLNKMVNEVIDCYIEELKTNDRCKEIDIRDLSSELALNVVTKALFNSALSISQVDKMHRDIKYVQGAIVKDIRQPYLNWFYYLTGKKAKANKMANSLYTLITNIIQDRRKSGEEFNDLLDMLLSLKYEDTNEGLTDKQILDEILIFFVAGHETVANTLSWAIYFITKEEEVRKKFFNEITQYDKNSNLGFEQLIQLQYTTQIIEESLRIYPPAWYFDRVAIEDDNFKGTNIKKGTLIGIFSYGSHRNELFWDNPTQFIPERFSKENKDKIIPYTYYPFGKGSRYCIGEQFSMQEMQIALFKLFNNFRFEHINNEMENKPEGLVTLKPKFPINMKLTQLTPAIH